MGVFDFVTDDKFRKSLESDHGELEACFQCKAWKSVHVLAGSIIETVLVDYLVASGYQPRASVDPLKMSLGDLIAACQKEGVLTKKTAELSAAIRSYRNLIHPGRMQRLAEVVDQNSATVSRALLKMVIDDVAARKMQNYGYTAQQIVAKLERDASFLPILPHLLKGMKEVEKQILLESIIPNRYFEIDSSLSDDPWNQDPQAPQVLSRLRQCFRSTFASVSDEVKQSVTKAFVSILKEADEHKVLTYETTFFRAEDLQFLPPADAALVKEHLLSRISKEVTLPLIPAIEGLPDFLDESEIRRLIDGLLHVVVHTAPKDIKAASRKYLERMSIKDPDVARVAGARFRDWVKLLEEKKMEEAAETVELILVGTPF